jgi:hypothetical protein
MSYVGRHLSLYSYKARQAWEDAKFKDADEVRGEYEKALNACPNYFKHNPRDFPDPFYDLLECIRQEYRELTRTRSFLAGSRIKWKTGSLFWKLRHPIQTFKDHKLKKQEKM